MHMPAESVEDPEQYEPELEVVGERLVAVIDRLWEDVGEDESEGDDETDTTTARTAIDAVVEPPEGASQSAVEAAVEAAESDKGRTRKADDDYFSM